MENSTLLLKLKQRLNKLDSQDYDNIECPKTRMGHITEEIKKIDKMTDDLLLTMMSEMKPILKHNREKMIWYAKNGTRYDFFHKILNNLG